MTGIFVITRPLVSITSLSVRQTYRVIRNG